MATVYVIHADEDRAFVEKRLIRPLPALGYDRWLSAAMLPSAADGLTLADRAIAQSTAVLVVVPASGSVSEAFAAAVRTALTGKAPVIPVYTASRDASASAPALAALATLGGIDADPKAGDSSRLARALAERLPPPDAPGPADARSAAGAGAPIGWTEAAFSGLLAESLNRHDYSRGEALMSALARHVADNPYPYSEHSANADLAALRRKRQFLLMRGYATTIVASGLVDFKVRRQYAQSLIELKEFDDANGVLTALVKETTAAQHAEQYEARGLMGRLLKQRYVDAPGRKNAKRLVSAIETYWSAFRENNDNVWHGINAATLILRAHADGIAAPAATNARAIAKKILGVLARRQAKNGKKPLDVWDYATRVEALVNLREYRKAAKVLDEYLVHPDMDAFEVSSTYRQFDEVLRLGTHKDKIAGEIMTRLAKAAERLRTGGLVHVDSRGAKPMLVRVSNPDWAPNVPGLEIHARLGTICSVSGSDRAVEALLRDPLVIALQESRPSTLGECDRSLKFVKVADEYKGIAGTFAERGKGALVAIIDNGIDVLHEAFLDDKGKSRIVGIWDQVDTDKAPPPGFEFGRYHSDKDIAGYVAKQKAPSALSRDNDGHGTHVASIAAGRRSKNFAPGAEVFAGGMAPEAKILVVISSGEEPTGYSQSHLAALSFIKQKAAELKCPVVVNLSQGMNAGAHDGRSVLELGFDAFSNRGTEPGMVVVKSAGNERLKRGHAKLTVPAQGADKLIWRCPKETTSVRLELWWPSASQYKFQLKSPSGDVSDWVEETNPQVEGYFKKRGTYTLAFVKRHPDNADSLLKIDVSNGVSNLVPSDWTLTVRAVKVRKNTVMHAWIERNGPDQTEFVSAHADEEMTLSVPGTCDSVIAVGAIDPDAEIENGQPSIMVGDFSSFGPTRDEREKPDISAPGVKIRAALRDSTDGIVELSGTSMAAPHVAGAIALLLSRAVESKKPWPNAMLVAALLRENTMNYTGDWDRGQGYGVIDVAALLDAT